MVLVNYAGKEINAKLVYYGPGLSGKTTNLEFIYTSVPATHRGKMVSMKTKTERTLFFDFLPLDLGDLGGYRTRFLLYTVPGQVYYNATRKLVLKGVDAVVFVADSKRAKMDENRESLQNLQDNLRELSLDLAQIPWVLQYNKRDLPDAASIEELNRALNPGNVPFVPAIASRGEGVFDTFKEVSKLLLKSLSKNLGPSVLSRPAARATARPVASVEAAPAVAPPPQAPAAARPPVETPPSPTVEPQTTAMPTPTTGAPARSSAEGRTPWMPRPVAPTPPPSAEAQAPIEEVAEPARPDEVAPTASVGAAAPQRAWEPRPRPEAWPAPSEAREPQAEAPPEVEEPVWDEELRPFSPGPKKSPAASEFIVSDPPQHSEPRTFAPTISPTLEESMEGAADESESPRSTEDAALQEQPEPLSGREAGKVQNGRARSGFFGWFRRSRPQSEELDQEEIEPQVVAEVSSESVEAPEERAPEMERSSEPAGEASSIETPVAPLELVRAHRAEVADEADEEDRAEEGEAAQEITVPVYLPAGAREVKLVLRLLVRRAGEETELEDEKIVRRASDAR
jgi:signal recognition particle receptor subunit beta